MIAKAVINRIENAVREVNRELNKKAFHVSWINMSESELFKELVSCIIGSRITYEKAKIASDALDVEGLLSLEYLLENSVTCEQRIHSVLKDKGCLYAFSKARYIVKTGTNLYVNNRSSIKGILGESKSQSEAREILSDICFGIGFKQASLFLRNIHYANDLAILDSHVIKYLGILGLKRKLHKNLSKNVYLNYENLLREYSKRFNTSVAKLDVSIWVVMRTVARDFRWML